MSGKVYETLKIVQKGLIRTIIFNRPHTGNAWNHKFFEEIPVAFDDAASDNNTLVCVLTGAGRFYTTGLDISFAENTDQTYVMKSIQGVFFPRFAEFPKPLVAIANGPVIGGGVTTLALCDFVYASDKATFQTPFTKLGLNIEGCSSYTFPRMMGIAKASEILLLGRSLNAFEAEKVGLVTRVFPHESLQEEAWKQIDQLAALPPQALLASKRLIRGHVVESMLRACRVEDESQIQRMKSAETKNAVKALMDKLKKKNV